MSSRVIYKYMCGPEGVTVPFPQAEVVHVAQQRPNDDWPTIWCMVDEDRRGTTEFEIVGTGQPLRGALVPAGSAICGPLVWHVMRVAVRGSL